MLPRDEGFVGLLWVGDEVGVLEDGSEFSLEGGPGVGVDEDMCERGGVFDFEEADTASPSDEGFEGLLEEDGIVGGGGGVVGQG